MNDINNIPINWDDGAENKLLGSLFPSGLNNSLPQKMQKENLEESLVNPLLKKHLREDGLSIKTEEKISVFEHKAFYNVSFKSFEKGSNMLNYHERNKPSENEMWILYEEDGDTNSNLFGSFVLVKMGDGYFKYLKDLKEKKTKIFSHIEQSSKGVIIDNFEKEVDDDYKALLKRTKQISKEKFLFALETEMRTNSDGGKLLKSLFGGLDGMIASIAEGINSTIEEVKFKKEDYTPQKKDGDFNLADFLDKFIEVNQLLLEKAVDYAVPDAIEKQLAKSFDDFVKGAKQFAKENLAPETIRFFEKTYKIFQEIVNFFKETAKFFASLSGDALYLIKAFIMGIINGLLSTIQMIVSLLGWLLKGNIDKKLTGQFYLEIQSKFEFIEDLIDLVSESVGHVFTAIKNLFKDFNLGKFKEVLSIFKDKAGKINRFDVAYFAGIFIFEVILGVILVVFTGGAAAIAEAANAAEKIAAFLKIFGREVLSTATMGIVDILKLFRILILKFVQACQKGWKGFKRFLENLFKNKVDDVAKSEGKVLDEAQDGASLISRGKYIGQVLEEIDIQKIKIFLTKHNVDLQIGKADGIVEVTDYFYPSGNVVLLHPHQAAMFITDGRKMKLVLREKATLYEAFHEIMHFRDCQKIGKKAYLEKRLVDREKFVYDKMVEYSKYLNRKELKHAEDYINSHYFAARLTDNFGNPLKEILPINLADFPKKRQGVNIDKILNLK